MYVGMIVTATTDSTVKTIARVVRKTEELVNFALVKHYRAYMQQALDDPNGNLDEHERMYFSTLIADLTYGRMTGGSFINPYYVMTLDIESSGCEVITFEATEETPDYVSD